MNVWKLFEHSNKHSCKELCRCLIFSKIGISMHEHYKCKCFNDYSIYFTFLLLQRKAWGEIFSHQIDYYQFCCCFYVFPYIEIDLSCCVHSCEKFFCFFSFWSKFWNKYEWIVNELKADLLHIQFVYLILSIFSSLLKAYRKRKSISIIESVRNIIVVVNHNFFLLVLFAEA